MSEQRHAIKRQVIELVTQNTVEAQRLQTDMSRLYRQRVIPLIDQYCSVLSEPDRLYRIESLVVDLGYVDAQHFEAAFIDQLRHSLYQALATEIGAQRRLEGDQEGDGNVHAQIELFTFFIRNGSLPWWADAAQPRLLETNLHHLIDAAPEPLRKQVREMLGDQRCLQRLVSHYPDELLGKLAGVLMPVRKASLAHDPKHLLILLQGTTAAAGLQPTQLRHRFWRHLLQIAGLGDRADPQPQRFYQTLLANMATELATTYSALLANLHAHMLANQSPMRHELQATLEALYRNDEHNAGASAAQPSPIAGFMSALRTRLLRLPEPTLTELLTTINELENKGQTQSSDLSEALRLILAPLGVDWPAMTGLPAHLSPNAVAELVAGLRATIERVLPTTQDAQPVIDHQQEMSQSQLFAAGLAPDQGSARRVGPHAEHQPAVTAAHSAQPTGDQKQERRQSLERVYGLSPNQPLELSELLHQAMVVIRNTPPRVDREQRLRSWQALVADLSADEQRQLLALLRQMSAGAGGHPATVAQRQRLPSLPTPVVEFSASEAAELLDLVQQASRQDDRDLVATTPTRPDFRFSAADEIYIHNAGLVILWPLFSHFFGRLGLIENRQLTDGASKQRAAGLLQYLATAESSPPEYLLPLNKLLCGLDLDEVFDFGAPITDGEVEECTNLLTAAIAQAPILRDMSVPGFQATFLLRAGVLSRRDGVWLLRVERETYDIVLDRFPWGWGWVKLPWMEAPLQVEW